MVTLWFAERLARVAFSGEEIGGAFYVALATNAAGALRAHSTYAAVELLTEATPRECGNWTVHPAADLTPPYIAPSTAPEPWTNAGTTDWPTATYLVVLLSIGGTRHLAFFEPLTPPRTLAPEDTLRLATAPRFTLAGG